MRHKNVVDINKHKQKHQQQQRNSDHDECCDDDGDGDDGDSDDGDGDNGDSGGDGGGGGGDGDMVGRKTEKYEQGDSLGSCDCFGLKHLPKYIYLNIPHTGDTKSLDVCRLH